MRYRMDFLFCTEAYRLRGEANDQTFIMLLSMMSHIWLKMAWF